MRERDDVNIAKQPLKIIKTLNYTILSTLKTEQLRPAFGCLVTNVLASAVVLKSEIPPRPLAPASKGQNVSARALKSILRYI